MEPTPPASPSAPPFEIPAPPPPPPPFESAPRYTFGAPPPVRAGQLTLAWGRFLLVSWLFVVASFIAIWFSSRNTGLSTWWLGPETEPRFILLNLLPFVAPSLVCLACQLAMRWLPWIGIAAALATAAIAWGDVHRVPGYAAAEFALAGGAFLASVACFAGVVRSRPVAEAV